MFKAWRVSHAERREEREAARGEDDDEEEDTPVVIPSSAVDLSEGNPGADAFHKGASDRRQSGPEQ